MIVRLIVFIAIFFIVRWLYRQFVAFKKEQSSNKPLNTSKSKKDDNLESMVRCEACRTFTPKSHAVYDPTGRAFCCKDHLDTFNTES